MSVEKLWEPSPRVVDFLAQIKKVLPPNPWIYYPGAGLDNVLYYAFENGRIVALDKKPYYAQEEYDLIGDYRRAPFKNQVFDMVFFKHNHSEKSDLEEILRPLKKGGLLVFVQNSCSDEDDTEPDLPDFVICPDLKRVDLNLSVNDNQGYAYSVFRNV